MLWRLRRWLSPGMLGRTSRWVVVGHDEDGVVTSTDQVASHTAQVSTWVAVAATGRDEGGVGQSVGEFVEPFDGSPPCRTRVVAGT